METGKPTTGADLARRVVDAYAHDAEGLTPEECRGLAEDETQAGVLCSVLGRGADGAVTQEEREGLEGAGFEPAFVQALAGTDGNRALQERAKWLGDHFLNSAFHTDLSKSSKLDFITELGRMGPVVPKVASALGDALRSREADMCAASALALGKIGPAAVPALIDKLESGHMDCTVEVVRALGDIGIAARMAIPSIKGFIGFSDDVDTSVRLALKKIGPITHQDIREFKKALKDDDDDVRKAAAIVLGKLGLRAKVAVPELIAALKDNSHQVRKAVVRALWQIGPVTPQVVSALEEVSRVGKKDLSRAARSALKSFKKSELMIKRLYDDDEEDEVRSAAANYLCYSNPLTPEVLSALSYALRDDDVRDSAAIALKRIGYDAVGVLNRAFMDDDEDVRAAAARALGRISKDAEGAVEKLNKVLLYDDDDEVRLEAARALGRIGAGGKDTMMTLGVALLNDDEEDVRMEAARALGRMGPASDSVAVSLVAALLNDDEEDEIRSAAAGALGRTGCDSKAAISALTEVFADDDEDEGLRAQAARALGWIGEDAAAAVPRLRKVLKGGDQEESFAAASALAMMGMDLDTTCPLLIGALKNKDPVLQARASEAICVSFSKADSKTRKILVERVKGGTGKGLYSLHKALLGSLKAGDTSLRYKIAPSWNDADVRQFGRENTISFVYNEDGSILTGIPGRLSDGGEGYAYVYDLMGEKTGVRMETPTDEMLSLALWAMKVLPDAFFQGVYFEGEEDYEYDGGSGWIAGRYLGHKIKLLGNMDANVIVHELGHHWDLSLAEEDGKLFKKISWAAGSDRKSRFDFVRPYAMTNSKEDIACTIEHYVCFPTSFRRWVRREMRRGNFEPAAKYLFVKYVMPFKGREYGLRDDSLSIDEVKRKYREAKDKSKTGKDTYKIILDIEKSIEK